MPARKRKSRDAESRSSNVGRPEATSGSHAAVALGIEARVKLALIDCIDMGLKRQFDTTRGAAAAAGISRETLSRIHRRRHERLSIASLLRIVAGLPIHVSIEIKLRRAPRSVGSNCQPERSLLTTEQPRRLGKLA
jgi:hypothetical protein